MSTRSGKLTRQVRVNRVHISSRAEPTRHSGLIGHNKHKQIRIIKRLDRRLCALNLAKSFDLANMSVVMIEYTVAIEKGRRSTHPPETSRRARARSSCTPISTK